MRLAFILSALVIQLILPACRSQKEINKSPTDFKVVGYYFLRAAVEETAQKKADYAFLDKITHLNLAFINPDTAGNFKQDIAIETFIKKAHEKNVKVLASIAGGGSHAYYARLLQDDKRAMLVNNLVALVLKHNLDGIDVDLEGADIDVNHEPFVVDLAAALKPLGKLMTAAIATAYKDQLTDKALQQFDFVNIMSYDATGPWNSRRPGQHSPFSLAENDLNYWGKTRNIPKEKLVLGVPFYGYGFGAATEEVASMSYKEIAVAYPASTMLDSVVLPDKRVMYFNGTSTIKKKTQLALDNAGGIMIWQLLGDAPAENSLLDLINKTSKRR